MAIAGRRRIRTFTPGAAINVEYDNREPTDVEAGDFNGDGYDDLAAVLWAHNGGSTSGPIKIALSNGSARTFAAPSHLGALSAPTEILARDMDSDGHLDLVVGDDDLVIFRGVGDGTFHDADTISGTRWHLGIAIDDFDRDGGLDVVGTDFVNGLVEVLLNTCGTVTLELASSANPVAQGTDLTLTGSLTSPAAVAATGTLTLKRGTTTLDSTDLNAGTTVESTMDDLTPATYTMTLEYSGDSRFFAATKILQQVVTPPPFGPPPGLNAISYGGPVQLSWYATDNTDHYQVWRNNGAGWISLGTTPIAAFTDNNAPSSSALLYKVRAVAANSTVSEFSNDELAITYSFTDPTLSPGQTKVKLAHLTELRTAANAVRALASLGATSWADSSPTVIRASHVTELRAAIAAALSNLGLDAVTYTDDPLNVSTAVKTTHFEQLRAAMR